MMTVTMMIMQKNRSHWHKFSLLQNFRTYFGKVEENLTHSCFVSSDLPYQGFHSLKYFIRTEQNEEVFLFAASPSRSSRKWPFVCLADSIVIIKPSFCNLYHPHRMFLAPVSTFEATGECQAQEICTVHIREAFKNVLADFFR